MSEELAAILILNFIGSVSGAFLALIIRMPRSLRGFQERASFSIAAGMTLSPITAPLLRRFFDVSNDGETRVAIATVTAFSSWWCARRLISLIDTWKLRGEG